MVKINPSENRNIQGERAKSGMLISGLLVSPSASMRWNLKDNGVSLQRGISTTFAISGILSELQRRADRLP